jgi:hypothetical protein
LRVSSSKIGVRSASILAIVVSTNEAAKDLPATPARTGAHTANARPRSVGWTWRPLVSARSRILGWSVLLLAAAMAAFTVAIYEFLVSSMNARVTAELNHEIAEFRSLAARTGAPAGQDTHDDRPTTVRSKRTAVSLLRKRTSSAVLEPDTVLLGVINGKIIAASRNFLAVDNPGGSVLARWSALRHSVTGGCAPAPGQHGMTPCPCGSAAALRMPSS